MQCSKITNTRRFKTRTSKSIPPATLILRELISASGWSSKAHISMKTNLYLPLVNYANLSLLGLRKRFKFILLVGPPITRVSDHIQRSNFFARMKTSFRNVSKFTLRENSIFGRTKPGTKETLLHIFDLFLRVESFPSRLTTLCESAYILKLLKIIRRSSRGFFFVFSSDWFITVSNLSYRRSGVKGRRDSNYQVQRDRDISLYMHFVKPQFLLLSQDKPGTISVPILVVDFTWNRHLI